MGYVLFALVAVVVCFLADFLIRNFATILRIAIGVGLSVVAAIPIMVLSGSPWDWTAVVVSAVSAVLYYLARR